MRMEQTKKTAIYFIFLLILAIAIRLIPYFTFGLFNDGYAVYVTIAAKDAIANGYIPAPLASLTAGPWAEQGLVYLIISFYYIFGHFLSLIQTMFLIKFAFTAISAMTIYLFAIKLSNSRKTGLIALLLYAVSNIAMLLDSFEYWYGDAFTPILSVISLLLLIYALESRNWKRIACGCGSVLSLIAAYLIWNGGMYALIAYGITLSSIYMLRKGYAKSRIAAMTLIGLASLTAIYVLLPALIQAIAPQAYSTPQFLLFSDYPNFNILLGIPMVAGQFYTMVLSGYSWHLPFSAVIFAMEAIAGFIVFTLMALLTIKRFDLSQATLTQRYAYLALAMPLLFSIPFSLLPSAFRYNSLSYIPIIILAAVSFKDYLLPILYLYAVAGIVMTVFFTGQLGIFHDPYMKAVAWIRNNTSQNSTFFTYDDYCLPIAYYDNRTCMDPQQGSNLFAVFLSQKAYNFSIINESNPDYIVISSDFWDPNNAMPSSFIAASINQSITGNDTNLALLERGSLSSQSGLDEVYGTNSTKIYKVIK